MHVQSDHPDVNAGAIYVLQGPLPGSNQDIGSASTYTITGEQGGDQLGILLASNIDINNDGNLDIITGAYHANAGDDTGRGYLFYGPITSDLSAGDADLILEGENVGERAGWDVAGGDLNGDGADDFVITTQWDSAIGSKGGAAYIIYGGGI